MTITIPRPRLLLAILAVAALPPIGCSSPAPAPAARPPAPDYVRPLPAGRSALLRVTDPDDYPDFAAAFDAGDARLLRAMDRSLEWFDAPSSRRHYPMAGVSHERARGSVEAMRELLANAPDGATFDREVRAAFNVYASVGWDDRGTVLFTGYYAPIFEASRVRTDRYRHPLYLRPDDLVTDPVTGAPLGRRRSDGGTEPYPTRAEIERDQLLRGRELVWLDDPVDAYIIHVNGSAKLRMTDGSVLYIGYAGKTDRPYASLGQAIIEAGLLEPGDVSLSSIRALARRRPDDVQRLMQRNENYVFFREYEGDTWPAGSLGVPVTGECSLATDKRIYPRGGVVLVDTDTYGFDGLRRPWHRFMLDQDTGGAIEAPGRADMFMGVGATAGIIAGAQKAEGRLYYLFLKPEVFAQRHGRPTAQRAGAK